MTILITGANGTVSSAVLASLTQHPDLKLRALVRDLAKAPELPGVEVAVADLDDPRSLADAFAGVDTVWLLTAPGPQAPHMSMNAVWAARQAGVRHIVRQSAIGAAHDAPTRNGRLHALSDAELMASGLNWTIIRPHYFMQNLLGALQGDTLFSPLGDGRLGMIDAHDIGLFAARVLADPHPHIGKIYTPTGPATLSLHDAAAQLGAAWEAPIRYQPIPSEPAYHAMVSAGVPPWIAAMIGEYGDAYARGWGDFTTTDFPDVVGHPARTLTDFAHQLRPA